MQHIEFMDKLGKKFFVLINEIYKVVDTGAIKLDSTTNATYSGIYLKSDPHHCIRVQDRYVNIKERLNKVYNG